MAKKVVVIGSGFAGLSAAAFMAKAGWQVDVIERHHQPGGRARQLKEEGFVFDMGPSWYWMPDVFERFFAAFGKTPADYYELIRLDPSYRVYWKDGDMDIPADYQELKNLFESIETGSGKQLDLFLKEAKYKYEVGIKNLVFKPGQSLFEFLDWSVISGVFRLDVFNSMKSHVAKYFNNEKIRQLMEFPVLFLGALAKDIPALYSLMNYADIVGGTWYPRNGMYSVVQAMHQLAAELGVQFHFNEEVTEIQIAQNLVSKVVSRQTMLTGTTSLPQATIYEADAVIGAADYHFIETALLPEAFRSYTDAYWESRVMAPSCLLYFVGLNRKLKNMRHHSLFFDVSFDKHADEIYKTKEWPAEPLFYVSATSVTDPGTAPENGENLFVLIPVAAGLTQDTEVLRENYFNQVMDRLEHRLGEPVRNAVVYKKSFAHSDFISAYHAFKGNAYGLANTLMQTANLKPSCRSKKLSNLFYTGQLTVPGPGVPPSLISGEVVAGEVLKAFKKS